MPLPKPSSAAAKDDYRRALQKIESLHGNMAVLARLGRQLREPDTEIEQLARLLQSDGALCANIIRISNTTLYGIGSRSRTIQEALAKVGFNRILSLVGAALSRRLFMNDLPAYGMSADEYWAHGYFCAVLLERQAFRLGASADDAYLLGLLHALGRVVINELLRQTKVEIYWDAALPCEEWEDILVGFRHDEAGAHLLRAWKFAPEVHQRVAEQFAPAALERDPLLRLLAFARRCSEANHFRVGGPPWTLPDDAPWIREPGYDAGEMSAEVEQARQACLQIEDALRAG